MDGWLVGLFWCDDWCFLEASENYDEIETSICGRTFDVSLHENDFLRRNRVHSCDFRTVDLSLPANNDGSRQIETSLPGTATERWTSEKEVPSNNKSNDSDGRLLKQRF